MILHARVARLYKHLHDPEFARVMRHIESASDEGLETYELEVDRLDEGSKIDLLEALDVMGYSVNYVPDEEIFYVSYAD